MLHEGIRFPLGVASAGLAVLAHFPDAEVEDYLGRTDLVREYGAQRTPGRCVRASPRRDTGGTP